MSNHDMLWSKYIEEKFGLLPRLRMIDNVKSLAILILLRTIVLPAVLISNVQKSIKM